MDPIVWSVSFFFVSFSLKKSESNPFQLFPGTFFFFFPECGKANNYCRLCRCGQGKRFLKNIKDYIFSHYMFTLDLSAVNLIYIYWYLYLCCFILYGISVLLYLVTFLLIFFIYLKLGIPPTNTFYIAIIMVVKMNPYILSPKTRKKTLLLVFPYVDIFILIKRRSDTINNARNVKNSR